MIRIIPRRPLSDDSTYTGYMESDRDWVLNNLPACVEFLEIEMVNMQETFEPRELQSAQCG